MYLKSIEVHGFKSFANKIVLDFHNGITGIVGPNGSGKSNISDAVRWVLGEQSAKQLRGANMQDVIFAGTESRKPVSYAYVAITLDNADRMLPVDYAEVTVARRVYRSGESEYLLNGHICRLKDVYELFYDTGIGKEGYSIIGQGQIERILNGKPEERRELFDEAAGIVKFKRRKAETQKKLEHERENLMRVHDILSELERQIGPLEAQAEKAKAYLKKKEELKVYEVNLFLADMEQTQAQLQEQEEKCRIAKEELSQTNNELSQAKADYDALEQDLERVDAQITEAREKIAAATLEQGRLEGEINVLVEQIHTAKISQDHYYSRKESIQKDKQERLLSRQEYESQKSDLDGQLAEIASRNTQAQEGLQKIQSQMAQYRTRMEEDKNRLRELLDQKGAAKVKQQRLDTMLEQTNIRSANLNQRKLLRKSEEADLEAVIKKYGDALQEAERHIAELNAKEQEYRGKQREWRHKMNKASLALEQSTTDFHKAQSRLETLHNIAERYDGYGNSIRRVMERKEDEPGIHGVVADLIKVDKKYEIAIETALGGSIQHIVTKDEETAKKMVRYLKENKYGRATFLPLTSVTGKGRSRNEYALSYEGVVGMANTLVKTQPIYEGIMSYLLGRVIVVDQIDHAVVLARESHYSLHIVTLEGEHLSPGGSISGGAFRNSSNLLGRKREIEELKTQLSELEDMCKRLKKRTEDIKTAQELLKGDQEENEAAKHEAYLEQNTAKMNLERVLEQKFESEKAAASLESETNELEKQLQQIQSDRRMAETELSQILEQEQRLEQDVASTQESLDKVAAREQEALRGLSSFQLEEANSQQQAAFVQENLDRINGELSKLDEELFQLESSAKEADGNVQKKEQDIEQIRQMIASSSAGSTQLEQELEKKLGQKETLAAKQKDFFQVREELTKHQGILDKEIFRLSARKEKLEEARESQTNYMWDEYELTPHHALEFRDLQYGDPAKVRKLISQTKDEIRGLGNVNVNAIEEYKEVSARYHFLKTQRDDLIDAEHTLLGIIDELDVGMRKQFTEKFAEIQHEFDSAFKELFGGGKGTLELAEADVLESGIRISVHPPGKKLQNMMQLSGGEKSLTAIALLFGIQNLKPSPFCLLDEIEAALDDSNVARFAKYLTKLTKNTQFIVITHRRGTMSVADRLYGITMQEKGVSTLVSVSLIENELDK